MSKMFDALKKAEGERRKEVSHSQQPVSVGKQTVRIQRKPIRVSTSSLSSAFLRQLGVLRNSLEETFSAHEKRSILFTSTTSGEGTTTIATNFARFLALQGTDRVLLCEMNARKPSFSTVFSVNGAGVTDYFTSHRDLSSMIRTPQDDQMDVLHVGSQDADIIQVRLKQVMPRMLEEAFQVYDTIILDAPPVIASPETPAMSAFVDGVVLVVQAGKTKREVALRSLESIAKFNGNLLGVVLNRKKFYIPEFLYKRV